LEKLDFIDSKFRLALLAAKRAKQLVAGSRKRIDVGAENPLTTAISEIYAGKIKYRILSDDEMERLNTGYYSIPPAETDEPEDSLFNIEPEDSDMDLDVEEEENDDEDEDNDTDTEDEDDDTAE
jgi:DNA-directed RNA polymerase subunit omega